MAADNQCQPTPEPVRQPVCDCCRREVDWVRGSMWHGIARICRDCFYQWYDPDNGTFDNCNPVELGNYIRKKHGLPPLPIHGSARSPTNLGE